jgi:hypothetical protein
MRTTGAWNSQTSAMPVVKRPNIWLRLTSNAWREPQETIGQRERARRNTLAAWIVLGLLVMDMLLLPAGLADPTTLTAILVGAAGIVIAAILNRFGQTTVAGVLLVTLVIGAIMGAVTGTPGGLPLVDMPAYDLMVIAIVIGASVLSSAAAFVIAAANIILIVLDFNLQTYAPDLSRQLVASGTLGMLARPIALQVIIATVAFLWVRGLQEQVRRADRAEEIAHLEGLVVDQKRALDYGVDQLTQAIVRSANGDYNVRVNIPQQNPLWGVGAQMNTFVQRLGAANQANFDLERARQETYRLATAIDDWRAGRLPIWPAPSGTVVDPLIQRLSGARPQSAQSPQALQSPQSPLSPPSADSSRLYAQPDSGTPFNWG